MSEPRVVDEYADAEVHRMLTEDGTICEQGIEVIRRDGAVLLRGQVETAHRRDAIGERVAAMFPDKHVCNDIVVTAVAEPAEPEVIT
ncbi:BON domain-containing protein [Catellatospora coxensis]|uniref:BON domain-containing protein n=1 Tax=Catellatospora coxensis TaxID=310354 RepID=UPI0035709AEE